LTGKEALNIMSKCIKIYEAENNGSSKWENKFAF
jgi:hypothetical protein